MQTIYILPAAVNLFGPFNAFILEIVRVTPLISKIKLTGVKFESKETLNNPKKCAGS